MTSNSHVENVEEPQFLTAAKDSDKTTNLANFLAIDRHSLDDELIKQPGLYYRIGEAYAEAAAIRDTKKEALATADAELDGFFRSGPEKLTEGKIQALVQRDPRHQEAFIEYNEAKLAADKMAALRDAFHARGYMLRDLVSLHTTGYFEADSVKSTASTDGYVYEQRRDQLAQRRQR
jgi:hypothetical protein